MILGLYAIRVPEVIRKPLKYSIFEYASTIEFELKVFILWKTLFENSVKSVKIYLVKLNLIFRFLRA